MSRWRHVASGVLVRAKVLDDSLGEIHLVGHGCIFCCMPLLNERPYTMFVVSQVNGTT